MFLIKSMINIVIKSKTAAYIYSSEISIKGDCKNMDKKTKRLIKKLIQHENRINKVNHRTADKYIMRLIKYNTELLSHNK